MKRETITYIDYEGNERTEDFYFNLTKAELTELNLSTPGGMVKTLERIKQDVDIPAMAKMFKDLILKAYGQKTSDGRGFKKSKELREDFESTEAYSQLFMSFFEDGTGKKAMDFFLGVIPTDLKETVSEELVKHPELLNQNQ